MVPPFRSLVTLSHRLSFIIRLTLHHRHHRYRFSPTFFQATTTPHRHSIAFHRLHASDHMPHPGFVRRQSRITIFLTFLKLLVCSRTVSEVFRDVAPIVGPLDVPRRRRRGGWHQQLQAIETELDAWPSFFWFVARVGRWFHVGGEVATTLLSCRRGRSDTSYGTTFGVCGHWSESSQWVDWLIGDVRHPAMDTARGFRSDDAPMVLPRTWIRLRRAYLVQFSLRLGANIQGTRAFWSHFFAKDTHQGMVGQALLFEAQNLGRSRPRFSADRIL